VTKSRYTPLQSQWRDSYGEELGQVANGNTLEERFALFLFDSAERIEGRNIIDLSSINNGRKIAWHLYNSQSSNCTL